MGFLKPRKFEGKLFSVFFPYVGQTQKRCTSSATGMRKLGPQCVQYGKNGRFSHFSINSMATNSKHRRMYLGKYMAVSNSMVIFRNDRRLQVTAYSCLPNNRVTANNRVPIFKFCSLNAVNVRMRNG